MSEDEPSKRWRQGFRGGIAKGLFKVPESIDEDNEEIRRLFEDGPIFPPNRAPDDET